MSIRHPLLMLSLVALGGVAGCTFDEGLVIQDMTGKIIVPRDAATRSIVQEDGSTKDVTDVKFLGPVYLGLYASLDDKAFDYLHPTMGPVFEPTLPGNTYPYGGTTVGDIRFACVEFLTCKVVSGRYVDFDEMVSWFSDTLGTPVTDASGTEIDNGDYLRNICFDVMNWTSESEIRLTVTEDTNGDGNLDAGDLDFVENSAGDFEAEFTMWQQEYFDGFALWGWMDQADELTQKYTTCDETQGLQIQEYNASFTAGVQHPDLLNYPSLYISKGDWVASEGHTYEEVDDEVELRLSYMVER